MKKSLLTLLLLLVGVWASARENPRGRPIPPNGLAFVENKGQVADVDGKPRPDVSFTADVNGVSLFFRPNAVSYVYSKVETGKDDMPLLTGLYRMDLEFLGANPSPKISASDAAEAVNHFYLPHVPQGVTARNYRKVVYENLYPNIDLVFYGADESGALKYDFVVRPGGNVGDVRLRYSAADDVRINADGSLSLTHSFGGAQEAAPYVFQETGAGRKSVASSYRLQDGVITFNVGNYDKTQTLVIDPLSRSWSRFYGDSRLDRGYSSAYAVDGSLYVVGLTQSTPFPVTPGAFQSAFGGANDAFITKFNAAGNVVWATLAGGSSVDNALSVAVNPITENIVVCGSTSSSNFPTFAAQQPSYGGNGDGFIMKFTPSGSIVWSSFVGGALLDDIQDVGISPFGEIYLTGSTFSPGLATVGQLTIGGNRDAFIAKFSSLGAIQWFTYYGGAGEDIANAIDLGPMGNIAIGGTTTSSNLPVSGGPQLSLNGSRDGFVARFTNAAVPIWSTYLGGSGEEVVTGITVFTNSNVVVAGWTNSSNYPTLNAFQSTFGGNRDAFVAKYNNATQSLLWSTYYGGSDIEEGYDVTIADNGGVHVVGSTRSNNFPVTAGAEHAAYAGNTDGFLVTLLNNGARDYATYIGGAATDIVRGVATNGSGSLVSVVGQTGSNTFSAPISGTRIGSDDAFIITYNVNIVAPCQVNLQASQTTVCPGTPVTITASGPAGNNYSWTGPGGFTATGSLITVSPNATGTYTVNVTGQGCLNSSATITINVFSPTNLVASASPASICGGQTTTLGVTPTGLSNYVWAGPNGVVGTGTSVSVSPGATTVYTVNAIDTNGCNSSATVTVTVIAPATTISPSQPSVCIGQSVTLTASAAGTYLWSTGATTQSITVSPVETTTYTVGTTTGSCSSTATVTVVVNPLPNVSGTASAPAICLGQPITLTGSGAVNYTWFNVNTGTTLVGPSVTFTPGQTTTYTVLVTGTDANGCTNSGVPVSFVVNPNPAVSIVQGATLNVCAGVEFELSVAEGGLSYVWGGNPQLNTQSILVTLFESETISVTGTDANGCSSTASIFVNVANPSVSITPQSPAICIGQSVTLTASAASQYSWSNGETTPSITVAPTQTTTYTVTALIGQCTVSSTVTVTVNPLPTVSATPSVSAICLGQSITVTGSGAVAYEWLNVNTGATFTGAGITLTPDSTAVYTINVTGTDANGCQNTASTSFVVNPNPVFSINQGASITVCAEQNFTLTASDASLSYQWSTNQTGQSITTSLTASQTISVTGTDANGCSSSQSINVNVIPVPQGVTASALPGTICAGQSVNLVGSNHPDVVLYEWVWNNGNNVQTGQVITVTPSVTTTYTLNAYNAQNCPKVLTVTVTVNPLPNIAISTPNTAICIGQCATLTGSGGIAYTWSWPGGNTAVGTTLEVCPTTTTSYTVVGIDGNGCQNTAALTVVVNPLPTISISGPAAICDDASGTLTASGAVSYVWAPSFGLSATTGASVVANPPVTTTYTITGTDANGCVNSTTYTLVVNPSPTVSIAAGDNELCIGESTLIVASSSIPATYSWGHTSSNSNALTIAPTETTTYTVIATTAQGCADTSTITIVVHPLPTVTATASPATICLGQSTTLTAAGASTYVWWNGETTASVVITPATTGTFVYSVVGTDVNGCVNNATVSVTVNPNPEVSISASAAEICFGQSVTFTASGNSVSYVWSTGGNTAEITVTPATTGTFTYAVTGANEFGCTTSASVSVLVRPIPDVQVNKTDVTCYGGANGSLALSLTGGEPPHTILWSGPNGYTSSVQNPTGLLAGVYTYTVTTVAGCVVTGSTEILEPSPFGIEVTTTQPSCNGFCDGVISVAVTGAAEEPVIILRNALTNNVIYATNGYSATFTGTPFCLAAGFYRVQVFVGVCTDDLVFELGQPDVLAATAAITNEVCYGDGLGSIDLTVTGGTQPYTFAWTGPAAYSAATEDLSGLTTGGIYSVFIVDANGCELAQDYTVIGPTESLAFAGATITDITCANAAFGAIDITVVGGVTPYTYAWTGPNGYQNVSEDLLGIPAGFYTGTVTDAVGCQISATLEVRAVDTLYAAISVNNIRCYGENTGAINMTPFGGTPPYNIAWTGPNGFTSANANLSGLFTGTYELTLTDANGCVWLADVDVWQEAELLFDIQVSGNLCYDVYDGAIDLTVFGGGVTPYVYVWSGGTINGIVTTEDVFNVGPGTYDLLIIDGNGCINFASVDFATPPAFLVESLAVTNVSCNGGTDGAIDLDVFGPSLTFSWSNGATTEDISGLSAGSYTVTITSTYQLDGQDVVCAIERTYTVTEPAELGITAAITDVACFGDATGAIDLTVFGGTAPYSFSWSNGATTEDISGLLAGDYTGTITDANGCQLTGTLVVGQPAAPLSIANVVVVNALCNEEALGSIDVTIAGGTAPYSYSWVTPSGNVVVSEDLFGIPAGTYVGTVTDANGCTITGEVVVGQQSYLTANFTTENVRCYGDNTGWVSVAPSGGVGPYTYEWSTGSTEPMITGLFAGEYTVVIRDANNCDFVATVTVTQPTDLNIELSSIDVACYGQSTGAIFMTVSGATPPYIYLWTGPNGFVSASEDLINIPAGTYDLLVIDGNSCIFFASYDLAEPAPFVLTIDAVTPVSCNGGSDGAIDATAFGTGLTFLLNGLPSTEDISGLSAGNYFYCVINEDGCILCENILITEPAQAEITAVITDVACFGDATGAIDVTVTGGTAPYTYLWSNSEITEDLSGLTAGTYSVNVVDANGCLYTFGDFTVGQPGAPLSIANVTVTDVLCNNEATGAIDVTIAGGTPPYAYSWVTPSGNIVVSEDLVGIPAGEYTGTVTDANGCTVSGTLTVNNVSPIVTQFGITNVLCYGENTGAVTVAVNGGVGGYSYEWTQIGNPTVISTDNFIANVFAGEYNVRITDANGCVVDAAATVTQNSELVITVDNIVDVACFGENTGSIEISVSGGVPPYIFVWSGGTIGVESTEDLYNIGAGTYDLAIIDGVSCFYFASVDLVDPALFVLVSNGQDDVTCNGGSDGAIYATVLGGGNYEYFLNGNPVAGANNTGLTAGAYNLTVVNTDDGCVKSLDYTITEPTVISAEFAVAGVSCFNAQDGAITTFAMGGAMPYEYSWTGPDGFSATTADITDLHPGDYTLTVTHSGICDYVFNVSVPGPTVELQFASELISDVLCFGQAQGGIDIDVIGGTAPYSYAWTGPNGAMYATQDLYNLIVGTYAVTVTDANGCQISASYDVAQPTMLWAGFTVENVRCFGDNTGRIDLNVFGGTEPYSYAWTGPNGFASSSDDLNNLFTGTYNITVTDANGCVWMSQMVVTQPTEIQISIEYEDACFGATDGFITAAASGGVPPYIYFWETTGTFGTTLTDLAPGTYDLIVIDGNNCEQFASVDIFELPQIVSSLVSMTQVTCPGGSNGELELSFGGGNDPYVLSVTGPGGYNETFAGVVEGVYTITGLAEGTYTIVVVDSNACSETFSYNVTTIPPTQIAGTVFNVTCNGFGDGAIELEVTAGTSPYEYAWTGPGGYSNDIRDISALEPGVYTVSVTDANGCLATADFTVTEPDALALSFVVTDQLCANEDDGAIDATVSGGTAPYSYGWIGPDGYTASTEDISGLATGFYTLVVTDNNGCTIVSDAVEVVPAAPVVIDLDVIGFGGLAFCQGGSVTIGDINGTPGDSYQWQIDTTGTFTDIAGATSPTFLVTSEEVLFADQFRYYRLVVTQGTCVFPSDPLMIQIFARPDITTEIVTSADDNSPFDVCIGEVITLSVPAAQPNTTYLWLINGVPSGSSHTITFTITDMLVRNVTVILQNTVNGCTNFNAVPYSFTPQSTPAPVAVDDDVIVCAGETVTLAVTPEPSTNYQWYLLNEGGDVDNINDYTMVGTGTTFDVSTVTDGVDFYVVYAERVPSECFAYTSPIRVTESVLTITSVTQTPGDCFDNELVVVATTNLDPDANPITYTLSGGTLSAPVSNGTGAFDGLGAGTYTLTVSDAAGCVVTQTVEYEVFTPFISNIVALNDTTVQLTIDYPTYNDPSRTFFVRYRVYPEFPSDGGPGQFVQDQVVVDDQNVVTIGGLQNNTRYEFYVWASCYDDPDFFNSPISNFVYVTTTQFVEACIRPGGLYVNIDAVDATTAHVYWNREDGAVYEVRYRLSGPVDGETIVYNQEFPGTGSCIGPFDAAPATITLTGLFPQSPYEIEVRKLCAGCTYDEFVAGDVSPWSSTIYFETGGSCTVPTATVVVSGNMDGAMTSYCGDVALTAEVTPADPGNYYYRWQYSATGTPGTFVNVAQGYGEDVLITNEFAFGTGFYRVIVRSGVCVANFSTNTEELTIIAKPTVVVNVDENPSTLLVENDHDNVAYITDCPGSNTGVVVVAAFGGTPPYQFSVTGPNGPWYNSGRFVNLPAGTYSGWVKDANGCVAEYDTSIPGQNPAVINNAYSDPTINVLTDGTSATTIGVYLNLSIDVAPPYVVAPNPVAFYRIAYRVTGTSFGGWTFMVVEAPADDDNNGVNDAAIVLTGLDPATSYDIRVRAICTDGFGFQSAWSPIYVATTGGIAAACEEVRNLVAQVIYMDADMNIVTDSVFVSWLAPDQPTAPEAYEVQWRQLTEDSVLVGNWSGVNNVTDLSYGINGLMEDTRYRVRVRSRCVGGGTSPWSVRDVRTPSLKQAAAGEVQAFTVYPNPNNGKFSVIFDSQEQGTVTLRLTDLVGRTIYTSSFDVNVGSVELPVEVSNYTAGVYTLQFVQGQAVTHVKLSLN